MSDGELPLGHATQGVELLNYIHTESGQTNGSSDIQDGIKIKSHSVSRRVIKQRFDTKWWVCRDEQSSTAQRSEKMRAMTVVTHCPPIISHEKTLAVTAVVESWEMYYFKNGWMGTKWRTAERWEWVPRIFRTHWFQKLLATLGCWNFVFVFAEKCKHEVQNFSRPILLITNQACSQRALLGETLSALWWQGQKINSNKLQVPISQIIKLWTWCLSCLRVRGQ